MGTPMTLQTYLAALAAAAAKATPGPWERDPYSGSDMQIVAHENEVVIYHRQHNRQDDSKVLSNVELLTLLRNSAALIAAMGREIEAARDPNLGREHNYVGLCQHCVANSKLRAARATTDAELARLEASNGK